MIIKRKLKQGEFSTIEQAYENIRLFCNISEEVFYGSLGAAKCSVIQSEIGRYIIQGFLEGLRIGTYGPPKTI